jgi:hypothetical protein
MGTRYLPPTTEALSRMGPSAAACPAIEASQPSNIK